MRCPSCGFDNPEGLKYCGECGTPVTAPCPRCGFANPPQFKFCGDCDASVVPASRPSSTPLLAAQPQPPSRYTPAHLAEKILTSKSALEGERKQVTVLFADLKGSMELLADRDPEEARQLLDPVLMLMMDAVHRYEGTVNQVMGDGIMALFGAPIAHEDHAVRACYAALAMQDTVGRYGEGLRHAQGLDVQIRVGLNAGGVVVRAIGNDLHMDYTAVGQTTHLAARMEQLARPGSTLLTAETLRLVEGLVRVAAVGPVPVKGLDTPVEVFELVGASALRGRFQARVAGGLTRFVGRDAELAALHQILARAGAGHGQVVALVGEAGVGKSRLVYEFVHSHRTQGWRVLESASVSYGKATPCFPVIDLLQRDAHLEERDDARTRRAKVTGQVATLDEALQDTVPPLLALLDALPPDHPFLHLDPPQRRQRTLEALTRVLLRESQAQPLLLVFEDLHWVDPSTLEFLSLLVDQGPTARIFALLTFRPDFHPPWTGRSHVTQVTLPRLPRRQAAEMAGRVAQGKVLPAEVVAQVVAKTDGVPLFVEELTKMVLESGLLEEREERYALAGPLPPLAIPATLHDSLMARLDRLAALKAIAQLGATLGREFSYELLQAVSPWDEGTLQRGLHQLVAAEFLYQQGLPPQATYRFKHALIQEAAYQSLLRSTRQRHHQRVAQVVEARFPGLCGTQPEWLAHHYTEAGLSAQAMAYWQRAGQRAIQRSAHVEAVSHLTRGVELLKTLPETPERLTQELILQTRLGVAFTATKGNASPETEQTYRRAWELCQQVGEPPERFPVLHGLYRVALYRGESTMA